METKIPVDQPAPDFTLPDLEGNPYTLSDFRGKIAIINFWSAECPWARRADEKLLPLLEDWKSEVMLFPVASNANEESALLQQVSRERRLPRLLHDRYQKVANLYGAQTTPHLFVVDGQGKLRYQGAFDDVTFRKRNPTQSYLRQAVEALLAGKQPDPAQSPPYGCAIVRYD